MIRAMFIVHLKRFVRDRGALVLSTVVPLVLFSIFALIFGSMGKSSDLSKQSLVIVNEDDGAFGRRLIDLLPTLAPVRVVTQFVEDGDTLAYSDESARRRIRAGEISKALIIPSGFQPSFGGEAANPPLLLYDSAFPTAAFFTRGLLMQSFFLAGAGGLAEQGFDRILRSAPLGPVKESFEQWSGLQVTSIDSLMGSLLAPGASAGGDSAAGGGGGASLSAFDFGGLEMVDIVGQEHENPVIPQQAAGVAVMFLLFSVTTAGGVLLQEKEEGTLPRLLASPVGAARVLAAKGLGTATIGFLQIWLMFLFAALFFGLRIGGKIPELIILAALTSLSATGLGLILAAITGSTKQLNQLSTLVVLSMSALGGSMFPRFMMPDWMKTVGLFTFNAWAVDGFTKVFWYDRGFSDILPQMGVLAGVALFFFLISWRLFRLKHIL